MTQSSSHHLSLYQAEYKDLSYVTSDLCTGDPRTDNAVKLVLKKLNISGTAIQCIDSGSGALVAYFSQLFDRIVCCNVLYQDFCATNEQMDALKEAGESCLLDDIDTQINGYEVSLFRLHKSWEYSTAIIKSVIRNSEKGTLYTYGTNDEGAKSFLNKLKRLGIKGACIEIGSSSRVFEIDLSQTLECEKEDVNSTITLTTSKGAFSYVNSPGLFAFKKPDAGSQILIEALPDLKGKSVLDVGCGAGVLSLAAHQLGAKEIVATDAHALSVSCANKNFRAGKTPAVAHCTFITDGLSQTFDVIITNPPFHIGKSTEVDMGRIWLKSCTKQLRPDGVIYLVANEFLKYGDFCREMGLKAQKIAHSSGFLVYKIVS
ncbi:MAG: class I SAM-dependent methyltransferase [Fibrobacterales bacterium]